MIYIHHESVWKLVNLNTYDVAKIFQGIMLYLCSSFLNLKIDVCSASSETTASMISTLNRGVGYFCLPQFCFWLLFFYHVTDTRAVCNTGLLPFSDSCDPMPRFITRRAVSTKDTYFCANIAINFYQLCLLTFSMASEFPQCHHRFCLYNMTTLIPHHNQQILHHFLIELRVEFRWSVLLALECKSLASLHRFTSR